jgi:hypothetical protein
VNGDFQPSCVSVEACGASSEVEQDAEKAVTNGHGIFGQLRTDGRPGGGVIEQLKSEGVRSVSGDPGVYQLTLVVEGSPDRLRGEWATDSREGEGRENREEGETFVFHGRWLLMFFEGELEAKLFPNKDEPVATERHLSRRFVKKNRRAKLNSESSQLKSEKTKKQGVRGKQLNASWDHAYPLPPPHKSAEISIIKTIDRGMIFRPVGARKLSYPYADVCGHAHGRNCKIVSG